MNTTDTEAIVIVGGGAGGLELACKLGRKLGRDKVTLVDQSFFHIWKPSLHEVAAGTMDMHREALPYAMLAHHNNFTFIYGAFTQLDAEQRTIVVSAVDEQWGAAIVVERTLRYSQLCIAVGSTSHYFNTPGAAEHTISLNTPGDAERFRLQMLRHLTVADSHKAQDPAAGVDVIIIGGGATGVELAAELREASNRYLDYGFRRLDPLTDIRITLLEGAPRILPPLPERVATAATRLLKQRNIAVESACRVERILPGQVVDTTGRNHPYQICVWAAGIRAPAFLATLGLPTNASGQLLVDDRLMVEGQSNIYAFGDCAACVMADGSRVPPRAQAAHQQADYLYRSLLRQARGQAPVAQPYLYRDYGSLVSVGTRAGVGTLMGSVRGRSWFVRGAVARMLYVSLHLLHHRAVLGWARTWGLTVARALLRRNTSLVKLH